jgi:hypothetical protein
MFRVFVDAIRAFPTTDLVTFRSSILFLFLSYCTYCYVKKQWVYRVRKRPWPFPFYPTLTYVDRDNFWHSTWLPTRGSQGSIQMASIHRPRRTRIPRQCRQTIAFAILSLL